MKKKTLGEVLKGLGASDLGVLARAFDDASCQESDLEPHQTRDIEPTRSWLRSRYYNSFSKNLYPYWEDEIVDFIEGGYSEWVITGCFTGSTKIRLLDGTSRTMEDLSREYPSEDTPFWVYSISRTGNVVPGKAKSCRKTGTHKEVWRVTLDNGEQVFCTPDHRFLMRDNTYRPAASLVSGDSLMPLYLKHTSGGTHDYSPEGYERVYDPAIGKFIQTHRVVGHYCLGLPLMGGIGNNRVLHHEKGKANNTPECLTLMDRHKHIWLHRKDNATRWESPEYREKQRVSRKRAKELGRYKPFSRACREAHREYIVSEKGKRDSGERLRKWNEENRDTLKVRSSALIAQVLEKNWSDPEFREAHSERLRSRNSSEGFGRKCIESKWAKMGRSIEDVLERLSRSSSVNAVAKELGMSNSCIYRMLRHYGYPSSAPELKAGGYLNHKVVSVEFSHYEDVYDFEVEEHHNFALEAGVFVHNSIGTGKSSAALVACMRKIYELSCWDIPQRLFRLADMTKIFFAYLSVNLKQADLTGFGQIRSTIDSTSYFLENFPRDQGINSVLKFPKLLYMIPGSDAISVIGTNLFGTILDEANFLRKSGMSQIGDVAKAQELYAETTDRRRSRFMYKGKDPGFSMLVSSSTVQTSFTSSRIEKAKGDKRAKVTNAALWEVKKDNYQHKTFFVFNGSDKDDPFIITDPCQLKDLIQDSEVQRQIDVESEAVCLESPEDRITHILGLLPEHLEAAISEVPIDFYQSFETDLFKALRNIAGVSIAPVGKLFTSRTLWNRAIDSSLRHPFTKKAVTLGLQAPGELVDYFNVDLMFGESAPLRHPSAPRFIHIDMSVTSCHTGISCFHQAGWCTNEAVGTMAPIVESDFMLEIIPPKPPDKIAFYKIRSFILMLRRLGMRIGRVTLDQYQSEDTIQLLTKARVNTGRVSMDKNDKPYLSLVSLYNEGRIRHYDHERYKIELFNLDHNREGGKVDHPDSNPDGSPGSKDISDSVAGAVFSCLQDGGSAAFDKVDSYRKFRVRGPECRFENEANMDWLLPKEYRGKVKLETQIVGGGAWPMKIRDDE